MVKKFNEFVEEGLISNHKNRISERDAFLEPNDLKILQVLLNLLHENSIVFSLTVKRAGEDAVRNVINHPEHYGDKSALNNDKQVLHNLYHSPDVRKHGSYLNIPSPAKLDEIDSRFKDGDIRDINREVSEWFTGDFLKELEKAGIETDYKEGEGWISIEMGDLCADNGKLIGVIKDAIE